MCFVLLLGAAAAEYMTARELVNRVHNDLDRASQLSAKSDKETERYQKAQQRLSDFDRKLSKGKFDKGKLDEAIDHVKEVVEHNTLSPEARDALTLDLRDLRQLRETRGTSY